MGQDTNAAAATEAASAAGSGARPGPAAGDPSAEITRLRFELLRSALYHDARASWYAGLNRLSLLASVVLGSSAVYALGNEFPRLGQFAGLMVAVLSGFALVWDFGGKARDHTELRRRYYGLLADAVDEAAGLQIARQMTLLYADEPSTMCAVNALAHNMAGASVFGDDFTALKVGYFRRRLRHIVAFGSVEFAPRR